MTERTYVLENEKVNPFFSVWFSTRKTVRYVLDNKTLGYSLALAAISGIASSVNGGNELSKNFDVALWVVILGIVLLGPLLGLLTWVISTSIFTVFGKWLGGSGTFKDMGKAVGVVMIPGIWMTPFWVLSFIFTANNMFLVNGTTDFTGGALLWLFVSSFVMFVFSIWMVVIQSQAIGEVHQFSSWKGFATLIIPSVVIGIVIAVIIIMIILYFFSFT